MFPVTRLMHVLKKEVGAEMHPHTCLKGEAMCRAPGFEVRHRQAQEPQQSWAASLGAGEELSAARRGAGKRSSSPAQWHPAVGLYVEALTPFPKPGAPRPPGARHPTPVCAAMGASTCSTPRRKPDGHTQGLQAPALLSQGRSGEVWAA